MAESFSSIEGQLSDLAESGIERGALIVENDYGMLRILDEGGAWHDWLVDEDDLADLIEWLDEQDIEYEVYE